MSAESVWAERAAGPPVEAGADWAEHAGGHGPAPVVQSEVAPAVVAVDSDVVPVRPQRIGVSAWWALIPFGLTVFGAIAALGGGSQGSSRSPSPLPAPSASHSSSPVPSARPGQVLSVPEYMARINAVCRDQRFDAALLPNVSDTQGFKADLARMRAFIGQDEQRIAAVSPPPALQPGAQEAVVASRQQLPHLDRIIALVDQLARSGRTPSDPRFRDEFLAEWQLARQSSLEAEAIWRQMGAMDCASPPG